MASHKIEDIHKTLLNQLLSDSGLGGVRLPPETPEVSSSSSEDEVIDQTVSTEEKILEEQPEEEILELESEKSVEEQPEQPEQTEIFPSPSLRKVLPEKIRVYEKQNQIHVLPRKFKGVVDPALIPKISGTDQQTYIDILGEITGCEEYKKSLAEFWFLDTLANLLRRAQEDGMERTSQAVLILWFCEWMKEVQHFDAADRSRMLKRFQDNMISAARFIAEEEYLPTPQKAGVFYKAEEKVKASASTPPESKRAVKFGAVAYECSMRDLANITHYIFDLFSTDYQYNLVRSVFTFTPEYCLIDTPYQILKPKRLLVPLKMQPQKEVHKETPSEKAKSTKGKKKKEPEEYFSFLALKAKIEHEQEEQENKDREQWHLRSHILPLAFAVDDEFCYKYWPPPTPQLEPESKHELEPKTEPEPELKGKKKGKKKGEK